MNLSKSTKDSNKFYSILLDARATTVSENTYDIAERLLRGETENAKAALEHLWSLKRTMQKNNSEASTLDMLIQYYQKKMDVVRTKEELIKKISRDSRTLLEEKRTRDSEIATVKQEISDCSSELSELTVKLDKLKVKEQELTLIDTQLKKELLVNENEIINGLFEIILSQQEGDNPVTAFTERLASQAQTDAVAVPEHAHDETASKDTDADTKGDIKQEEIFASVQSSMNASIQSMAPDITKDKTSVLQLDSIKDLAAEGHPDDELLTIYKESQQVPALPPPFPKSVVKTTKGRVIGEYFYDPKAYKNKRHYIFNSKFFLEQLSLGVTSLQNRSDQNLYAELLQMIQDTYKRISENQMMHFEVSTSEILNDRTLRELWQNMKSRDYVEAGHFCKRLNAKIGALKSNYHAMLKEQMERYAV